MGLAARQHRREDVRGHFQRNVQIEIMLHLELERHVRRLKERQTGAVVHLVESMQGIRFSASLGFTNLKCFDQRQAEEVFIKRPRLRRITAAIRVVMQSFDHVDFL